MKLETGNPKLCIAIIGSGPAGCYLADHLLRMLPEARIDILERLPVPFGLVRYGVAPDHQGTKAVARVLDRTLSRDRVRFFGNVEVGRDVALDELRSMYHIVVLATGAMQDRRLGIPGETLPGVVGSGAFVSWYNGHPRCQAPALRDVRSAVIIGNGNVALDVARILAKARGEFNGSDLPSDILAALSSLAIKDIHIVGRRSAAEARFSEHELAELGTLKRARPVVPEAASLGIETPSERVLRQFVEQERESAPVSIHFHFGLTPVAFRGEHRLEGVRFRAIDGSEPELPAQFAVTCIGYEAVACCSVSPRAGTFANEAGKIAEGLYVVGWAKRGPSGTIPTNRSEAQRVAQTIVADAASFPDRATRELTDLLRQRNVQWVDYQGWKRIEAIELAHSCNERCRAKLLKVEEMLHAAQTTTLPPGES